MNGNYQKIKLIEDALTDGQGVLRLAPAWVPRAFMAPGRRLKLHPDDIFALGKERGGINERWFASTTNADNGPNTPFDEGLSYIYLKTTYGIEKILLKEAIEISGNLILGNKIMKEFGGWKVLCKFFDNKGPIHLHLHLMEKHASNVGKSRKPESYYFPPQYNMVFNDYPYTFFGLNPGTTKEQVRHCLIDWEKGDNGILDLSRAYRLKPGTGWNVPDGVLHAPGSLVTYEPQRPYDLYAMFQSLVNDMGVSRDLLVKDVPEDKKYDFDYLLEILNWEENTDPDFFNNHFIEPREIETDEKSYIEKWIVYGSEDFSAKELTVLPGRTVIITENAPYGIITVQGHGTINDLKVETPSMIRFGDITCDEFFVTYSAANNGVVITNNSQSENLVMLKHFGPEVK